MAHPVLPIALRLDQRPVLVIGGDAEAVDKLVKLEGVNARLTVVAPEVDARIADLARTRKLVWYVRTWCESDLFGQAAVILTPRSEHDGARLFGLRKRYGYLLCAVDQPAFCDFFFMSTVQRGPLQLGITTGGGAPLLARKMRQALERGLPQDFADFCREFEQLRASVASQPKAERMIALEAALNGFAMEVALRYPETVGASVRATKRRG